MADLNPPFIRDADRPTDPTLLPLATERAIVDMARDIIDAQQREIATMKQILGSLYYRYLHRDRSFKALPWCLQKTAC